MGTYEILRQRAVVSVVSFVLSTPPSSTHSPLLRPRPSGFQCRKEDPRIACSFTAARLAKNSFSPAPAVAVAKALGRATSADDRAAVRTAGRNMLAVVDDDEQVEESGEMERWRRGDWL